ncbi:hypothetical protein MKY84_07395 [Chryseomicrobium sp. FSL W7-1435]|uniref:hypothetical protein n=1 Tax=Chryseomicrobium sp. FSL W7-1435 TaxID=2921704 RepID=UPI00315A4C92
MKKQKLERRGNMIIFPGALTTQIDKALRAADRHDFMESVRHFETAKELGELEPEAQLIFAYALYEIREFEKALIICDLLLHEGFEQYEELMDLYVTLLVELRRFEEADALISTLIDERVLSPERKEKWLHLRDLSGRLAANAETKPIPEPLAELKREEYEESTFFDKPLVVQYRLLLVAFEGDCQKLEAEWKTIVEHSTVHPVIQTLALLLLISSDSKQTVRVRKFNWDQPWVPAALDEPFENTRFHELVKKIEERLENEPTAYLLIRDTFQHHCYLQFPYVWNGFSDDEVVDGYTLYFEELLQGEAARSDQRVLRMIHKIDQLYALLEIQ